MLQPNEHQHHTIWTPELVEISLPLAGIARRVVARIVDQLIITLFLAGVWIGFFLMLPSVLKLFSPLGKAEPVLVVILFVGAFLFSVASYFLYYWAFHTFNYGKTPGKVWLGIRVVTDRGGQINIWTSFIRELFDLLDMLLFSGSIAAIMILVTDQEKRIADFAAGTIVILDR